MRISDWSSDVCSSDLGRAQRARNVPLVLDGEVGDAASGVEPVRADGGLRRTDVPAAPARAAMIALRRVRLQRQIGEDFAEAPPGAEIQRHQVAVLALPAEAAGLGEVLFHAQSGRTHV